MRNRGNDAVAILVEDDDDSRRLYQKMLASHGYQVVARERAEGLVDLAVSEMAAVIIVDISLPGLSGIAACERLKSDPRTCKTPVVVLTAHASFESVRLCTLAGADAYLLKPARPSRVLQVIDRLISGTCAAMESPLAQTGT